MKRFLLLISSLVLISCGDDDMKKYYKLDELRILAIHADSPEINSASSVNLTPFFSYPSGGDTTIDISYKACIDPGISYGASISCDGQTLIANSTSTYTTSTLGSSNFYTGNLPAVSINIPSSAFTYLNSLSSAQKFNGIDVIVIFEFSDQNDSTQKITTFKRIRLSTKTSALNSNPSTSSDNIIADGVSLASFPNTVMQLGLDSPSSAQTYDYQGSSSTDQLTEKTFVSWFSNVGEFKFSRTDADETVEYDPGSETSGVIVAIYRDSRGGVKIVKANFP